MLRLHLRNSTADIHERLHHHPVLAPLTSEDVTMDQYRHALTAMHGFYAPMEMRLVDASGLEFRSPRTPLLAADLHKIAGDQAEYVLAEGVTDLPEWTGGDRVLGAAYVLDGAAHGGRSMVGDLRTRLGLNGSDGTTFMASVGIDAPGEWRTLMKLVEDRAADELAALRVIDGAIATFSALERWLTAYYLMSGRAAA